MDSLQKTLSLTNSQLSVYVLLTRTGPLGASQIAQKLSLSRTGTYDVLSVLEGEGYVSSQMEGKRKLFVAVPPATLQLVLDQEKARTMTAQEELDKLISEASELSTSAVVYTGKRGLRSVLEMILSECRPGQEVLAFGEGGTKFKDLLGNYYHHYIFRHIDDENRISFRALLPSEEASEPYVKELGDLNRVSVRFALSEFSFPTHIRIFSSHVALFLLHAAPLAVVITDQRLADTFRYWFEREWERVTDSERA